MDVLAASVCLVSYEGEGNMRLLLVQALFIHFIVCVVVMDPTGAAARVGGKNTRHFH